MLKTEIQEFVSTQPYRTLTECKLRARRREIELEIKRKEVRKTLGKYQTTTKRFKSSDSSSRSVDKRSSEYGKCEKFHDGSCRSFACCRCGNEGHFGRDLRETTRI